MPLYHVTSVVNRKSIARHGLDWRHMGAARGIAGSPVPEVEGCLLAQDEFEADWFVRMNNTGGPVDVWRASTRRSSSGLPRVTAICRDPCRPDGGGSTAATSP